MRKELQKVIDEARKEFGELAVAVHQYEDEDNWGTEDDLSETTISFNAELVDDPFMYDNVINNIVGGCDSGFGFGWRDLQLCCFVPGLR